MDKKLKTKWVKALRSGRYSQGHDYLFDDNRYCCLGVLCRVMGMRRDQISYAGMPADAGVKNIGIPGATLNKLARMNDGAGRHKRHSFAEIADYIEAKL